MLNYDSHGLVLIKANLIFGWLHWTAISPFAETEEDVGLQARIATLIEELDKLFLMVELSKDFERSAGPSL